MPALVAVTVIARMPDGRPLHVECTAVPTKGDRITIEGRYLEVRAVDWTHLKGSPAALQPELVLGQPTP